MKTRRCPYEALASSAMPVRDAKHRGRGSLADLSEIGWSNSLGWYESFRLLVAVNPARVITGFGLASARTKDQPLAETFFARSLPTLKPPSQKPYPNGSRVMSENYLRISWRFSMKSLCALVFSNC